MKGKNQLAYRGQGGGDEGVVFARPLQVGHGPAQRRPALQSSLRQVKRAGVGRVGGRR